MLAKRFAAVAACVGMLALAPAVMVFAPVMAVAQVAAPAVDPNAVQAGPFLQFVIQFVLPAFGTILTALVGWAVWYIKQRTGLQIEAQYRDAFQKALEQAAGGLLNNLGNRVGSMQLNVGNAEVAKAINYVLKSAPDAVTHFGLDNKRDEILEKLANKVGVLTAGPPAVAVTTPATAAAPAKPSTSPASGAGSG